MPTPTLTEGSIDRHPPRASTAPKLVLEPVRASSQWESHPLAVGRYLIGAALDCDIVIAVGGVAPQHCLMIVGANKTIVKAISPLTWINDGPLTEAVLKLGERLILGPVELRTRRPEVSEWIELREEFPTAPTPPPAPVAYQPPEIEQLLDQALQQLQTAIDDSPGPSASWSEDLPLTEAVQIHSAVVGHAAPASGVSQEQPPSQSVLTAAQKELSQRALEMEERSRALTYIGTELSTREEQLRSRELALASIEAQVEQVLTQVAQREQSLTAQEQALQVRNEAETDASRRIAEMTRSLEAEQARLQLIEDSFQVQESELEQQAQSLSERTRSLELRESELTRRAEAQPPQARSVQALAAVSPLPLIDTRAVELREAAVTKREAVLASSHAALQATREQIAREAAELEQRFQALLDREQAGLQQQTALTEQTRQSEARTREAASQLAARTEREQSVAASLANLIAREAALQKLKAELDRRDRELSGQRSELDIRDEALNQQFSQLQLDRSALRAGQSKLQLAEQAANQRLAGLDGSNQQKSMELSAELVDQRTRLEQDRAECQQERQSLESLRLHIEVQRKLLEQEPNDRALLSASEVQPCEVDNEWQKLAAERARLVAERRDVDEARATQRAELRHDREPESESNEVSGQLLALVSERQSLAELRDQLLHEQEDLRLEREEIRRTRVQFDRDHQELLTIQTESVSERDAYLIERQAVIAERQSLQDRERQIQQTEAEIEQFRQLTEQMQAETETVGHQMATQRVHLEEEWASLRQERVEFQRAESELDAQREELTHLAQQLTDLRAGEAGATPPPVLAVLPGPPPVLTAQALERHPVSSAAVRLVADEGPTEVDSGDAVLDDNAPLDPLAGFASFSSIGSAIDDELPPEIEEIMRKAGAPARFTSTALLPHGTASAMTIEGSPPRLAPARQNPTIDARESQRLQDLLRGTSESYVEAASARFMEEFENDEVVEDEPVLESPLTWAGESTAEGAQEVANPDEEDSVEPDTAPHMQRSVSDETPSSAVTTAPKAGADASELRSRLSAMFGIDLGRLGKPSAQTSHINPASHFTPPPTVEPQPDQPQPQSSSETETLEAEADEQPPPQAYDSRPVDIHEEPTPEPQSTIDESLDPVAAYMEQLLARTRKSKDGHAAKTESPASKPAPSPVVPVVSREEPEAEHEVEVPAPLPVRQTRKLEAAEKQALRANLDSFREIANTQARSDVARSELRRLKITEKVKHIFLAISGGIALILATTELWTTRRYRIEIASAVLATAFLGYDYYRTKRRLHELELIVPQEAESDDMPQGDSV